MGTLSAVFPFFIFAKFHLLLPGNDNHQKPDPLAADATAVWCAVPAQGARAALISLSTYAIKDTVSVLYWYEKLSIHMEIFGEDFRIFFFGIFCFGASWRARRERERERESGIDACRNVVSFFLSI